MCLTTLKYLDECLKRRDCRLSISKTAIVLIAISCSTRARWAEGSVSWLHGLILPYLYNTLSFLLSGFLSLDNAALSKQECVIRVLVMKVCPFP